ncbi:hypothetical protein AVL50_20275 [Flammeovirga sp. SJP92]|nr:hypothetical protein AVL50_20275 [Flammeovirga sp. SJP92]
MLSCESPVKNSNKVHENDTKVGSNIAEETIEKKTEIVEPKTISDSVQIDFKDFEVILSEYLCYNLEHLKNYKSDTVYIDEEVGFDLDNQLLRIASKAKEDRFEVYVSFEQDLRVIVSENQLEDLEKWHTQEPFVKILDSAQYYYRLPSYKINEKELSKDFKKIKEEILKLDGEYIDSTLNTASKLEELPILLWISKVLIKIVYTDINGIQRTILLENQSSWGC